MQDKRRRNDFASTEVGEATGGRVTQQAFDEKDSGISNAAMPGTRGDGRKEAQENTALLVKEPAFPWRVSLPFLSPGPFACFGSRLEAVEDKLHAGAGI